MTFASQEMSTFISNSVMETRQQMDESNHDMVNTLTQQMGTIFNPFIQNTNQSYQQLATKMNRIANFFGIPPSQVRYIVQPQVVRKVGNKRVTFEEHKVNQGQ